MENANLLPENEVTEFENRLYLNPQVGVDETNTFIDKFRDTQRGNTQEIAQQTGMLGTDVPSSLGGLTGAGNYFTSRYQTPQTNAVVQNLRTAAQATALNEVLANEQAMWKKRYNDAYKAYQKRQNRKSNPGGGGNPVSPSGGGGLDIDTNSNGDGTVEVSTYQPGAGEIIPNTGYVSDYQDASSGQWYQLTSPREIDVIAVGNTLAGKNPSDGATVSVNGKTLRYVAATDSWYEQTSSAGPNSYSPRTQ